MREDEVSGVVLYRVNHKEWNFRDEGMEFMSVSLYLWFPVELLICFFLCYFIMFKAENVVLGIDVCQEFQVVFTVSSFFGNPVLYEYVHNLKVMK